MKYHVLAVLCLMALIGVPTHAQTYSIDWQEPDTMYASEGVSIAKRTGYMHNLTSTTKNILFRFDLTNMVSGHSPSFCFGDNCFYLFGGEDNPWERAEQVLPGNGQLTLLADLGPNGLTGTSSITYKLFDSQDTTLDILFTCTYVFGVSSVPDASELGFRVGPNPSSDFVTISGGTQQVIGLNLYSSQGTLLRTYGIEYGSNHTIGVSDLPVGAYHLVITLSSGSLVRTGLSVIR